MAGYIGLKPHMDVIAASKTPRLRYIVGSQAKLVTRLRRFLPEPVFERGVRSTFWLDRKDE